MLVENGEVKEEEIQELLKKNPGNPENLVAAGKYFSFKGNLEKAEKLLETAVYIYLKKWNKGLTDINSLTFTEEEIKFFHAVRELAIVKLKLSKHWEALLFMNLILKWDEGDRVIKRLKIRIENLTEGDLI